MTGFTWTSDHLCTIDRNVALEDPKNDKSRDRVCKFYVVVMPEGGHIYGLPCLKNLLKHIKVTYKQYPSLKNKCNFNITQTDTVSLCTSQRSVSLCTTLICIKEKWLHASSFDFVRIKSLILSKEIVQRINRCWTIFELKYHIQLVLRYRICNRVKWLTFTFKKVISFGNFVTKQNLLLKYFWTTLQNIS